MPTPLVPLATCGIAERVPDSNFDYEQPFSLSAFCFHRRACIGFIVTDAPQIPTCDATAHRARFSIPERPPPDLHRTSEQTH
jgi:hypothetical protein